MLESIQCISDFDETYSAQTGGQLIMQIDGELFGDQPEKQTMLHLSLQQLLIVIYRLWRQNETKRDIPNGRSIQYFRRFQQLVRQSGTANSVAQLASELAITPVHLNRICQNIAGKSASQLVQEHILNEARKYLTYTSYSVSEIAYLLHFQYPNYFAKFFKKHTGMSPTAFRDGQ